MLWSHISFSGLYDQGTKLTAKTSHFRTLFSVLLVTGLSTRLKEKYKCSLWSILSDSLGPHGV